MVQLSLFPLHDSLLSDSGHFQEMRHISIMCSSLGEEERQGKKGRQRKGRSSFIMLQAEHAGTPLLRFNHCHTRVQYMVDSSTTFHALI